MTGTTCTLPSAVTISRSSTLPEHGQLDASSQRTPHVLSAFHAALQPYFFASSRRESYESSAKEYSTSPLGKTGELAVPTPVGVNRQRYGAECKTCGCRIVSILAIDLSESLSSSTRMGIGWQDASAGHAALWTPSPTNWVIHVIASPCSCAPVPPCPLTFTSPLVYLR
jgi:hypothetical protein